MNKVLGVILMITVIVVGVFLMKDRFLSTSGGADTTTEQSTSKTGSAKEQLEAISEQLEKNYPSNADEVVEIHNNLMGICYKYNMDEKTIKLYVETIRKIYSNEFNELNPEETQISQIKTERDEMGAQKMELVASNISKVYIAQDENGEDTSAEVNVTHATNLGSLERTYHLIKEDDIWKINGWEEKTASSSK